MPSPRSRRLFLGLLSLPLLFLLFLGVGSPASRKAVSRVFSTSTSSSQLPDEIFGLLHFVTSPDEAGRVLVEDADGARLGGPVVPEEPIELAWYALGSTAMASERVTHGRGRGGSPVSGWGDRLQVLREERPLVVFSKSYCPYSKRAKRLLELYELSPPPKIVEVDLRADSSQLKTLLTRLTHRSTFPNVVLHGRSIGGSDELMRLHEADQLRETLESAGVTVRWTGEGSEGMLL